MDPDEPDSRNDLDGKEKKIDSRRKREWLTLIGSLGPFVLPIPRRLNREHVESNEHIEASLQPLLLETIFLLSTDNVIVDVNLGV